MRNISQLIIQYLSMLLLTAILFIPAVSNAQTTTPSAVPPADVSDIYVIGTCLPPSSGGGGGGATASTKFFVNYDPQPDSVFWFFAVNPDDPNDSLTSTQLQPIVTFPAEGSYQVTLSMWVNGDSTGVVYPVTIKSSQDQLQIMDQNPPAPETEPQVVSGELVLCPGDVRTLQAELAGGGSGSGGGGGGNSGNPVKVTWFRPQSAEGDNPVRDAETIEVTTKQDPVTGKYLDVGTYYVVYNGGDCPIYQSFRVVIYNEEDQNGSIWYFGNGAGIDFRNGAEPLPNSVMAGADEAPEGSAIVGDPNADILFLTNGDKLWFYNDLQEATNGNNIAGGGAGGENKNVTQNSLFLDFSGDETLYYLFTINNNRQLSFSTLDLKADPLPGIAISDQGTQTAGQQIKAIPLHNNVAEKLTSTGRTDGGYWVIAHELGSDLFLSYPVTNEGIGAPVTTNIGTVYGNSEAGATGYMRFSEDGEILASAINSTSPPSIDLFHFDADTGTFDNHINIPIDEGGTLYGLSFVDNRLYATVNNSNGGSYLIQYTVDSTLNRDEIIRSKVSIPVPGQELGAVEQGPDGTLYIAINGAGELYQIQSPADSLLPSNQFLTNPFDLEGGISTLGLPNFGANSGMSVPEGGVSVEDVCWEEDVVVAGTQRYSSDRSLNYFFYKDSPDGTVIHYVSEDLQQQQSMPGQPAPDPPGLPFSVYQSYGPGTYYVRMTITNPCGEYPLASLGQDPVIESFEIHPLPEAAIDDTNNLILCENQEVTLEAYAIEGKEGESRSTDPTRYTFVWYDQTGNAILKSNDKATVERHKLTVNIPGTFQVVVYDNVTGCSNFSDAVEVLDNRPDFDLGDDIVICEGGELGITELDANFSNSNEYTFKWYKASNGAAIDENSKLPVTTPKLSLTEAYGIDTELAGTYRYVVEVTPNSPSPERCPKSDTIDITVTLTPTVRIVASNNNCTGTATLTADVQGASGEISYTWFGPGIASGGSTGQVRIDQSGEYYVQITDGTSQCSNESEPITINLDNPLEDLEIDVEAGCGEAAQNLLEAVTSYTANGLELQWFRKEGNNFVAIPGANAKELYADAGEYMLRATINNPSSSCNGQTKDVTEIVTKTIIPVLQASYVICPNIPEMASDTISVEGYSSYEWRNAATGQVVSRRPEFIVTQEGNYELRVNDCSEPVRFRVIYDCTPVLWFPNAIRINSPVNGNSTFRILNQKMAENITHFQILIMNRWGEVLFQSNDPAFEWDGTDRKGDAVMVNTYAYIVTYRNKFGEDKAIKKQRGGITVLR